MRLKLILILTLFLLLCSGPQRVEAFTHGFDTTWNGGLLGGGWVCFQSAVIGCSQGFNAACDGVTDDKTAWNSFLTYASGVSDAKLYIPPGANCINSDGFQTAIPGANTHIDGTKVPKLTLWAYGASFDTLFLGLSGALFQDNTHNALIQTVSAGSGSVTLVSAGDAAKFAIDDWIIVCGLALQNFGYPPNWNIFEYHKVTGVSGSTITLDNVLTYSYKSTWPQADIGNSTNINLGGPASIYRLKNTWDQELTIYGLRVKQLANGVFSNDRSILLDGMSFDHVLGPAPSVAKTYTIYNSNIKEPEFDKLVDTMVMQNVTGSQFVFQSSSFNSVSILNASMTSNPGLNGTTKNMSINNMRTAGANIGPVAYGHGTSLSISNSTVNSVGVFINNCMPTAFMTFSSGTFTLPKSPDHQAIFFAWAAPDQEYYFAESAGTPGASVPHTQFKIIDIREDASNYYADTDIVGALPTPLCFGMACSCYTAYQASSVTQTNTGPADLTPAAP